MSRYPRHRIGWLFVAFASACSIGGPLSAYAMMLHEGDLTAPYGVRTVLLWFFLLLDLPSPSPS